MGEKETSRALPPPSPQKRAAEEKKKGCCGGRWRVPELSRFLSQNYSLGSLGLGGSEW